MLPTQIMERVMRQALEAYLLVGQALLDAHFCRDPPADSPRPWPRAARGAAQPVPQPGLADRQAANLTLTLGEAAQSGEPSVGPARGSRPWT